MTDQQDVSIGILEHRVDEQAAQIAQLTQIVKELRDGSLKIEGGKLVLYFIGGLLVTLATAWYGVITSPAVQRILRSII